MPEEKKTEGKPPKKRFIDKIGCELEGSWRGTRGVAPFEDVDIKHDGSVQRAAGCQHVGEIVSPAFERLEEIQEWVKVHHPHGTNNSCGFHIHVSLQRVRDYSRLMEKRFNRIFLRKIREWGRQMEIPKEHYFWKRVEGENQYCEKNFRPTTQAYTTSKPSSRYSQLNYCYKCHGTLELRVLPMFAEEKYTLSALEFWWNLIEDFLAKRVKTGDARKESEVIFHKLKVGDMIRKKGAECA